MQGRRRNFTNFLKRTIIFLLFVFLVPKVYASESPSLTPPSLPALTATPSGTLSVSNSYVFNDTAAYSGGAVYIIGGNTLVPSSPQPSTAPSPSPAGITMIPLGSSYSGNFTVSSGETSPGSVTSGSSSLLVFSPSASPLPLATPNITSAPTIIGSSGTQLVVTSGYQGSLTNVNGTLMLTPSPTPQATPTPIPSLVDKTSPCSPIGDVNDDKVITNDDSQAALQIVAALPPYQNPTADQIKRADVNGDGRVMSSDALRIQRYIKGMDTTFKACSDSIPQPNLAIESISFLPNPYSPKSVGDGIDLDVVIKNYGTVDILGDKLLITKVQARKQPDLTFPLITVCTPQLVGPVKAGESITQKIRGCGIYDVAGNWNFNVTVDSTNVVTESNEQDNTILSGPIVNPAPTIQPTPIPTASPNPTATPISISLPTPSPNPSPVASSLPIPSSTPVSSPSISTSPSNSSGTVSLIPSPTATSVLTLAPSGVLAVNNSSFDSSSFTLSNNSGEVTLISSSPQALPFITTNPMNILTTGFNFVINGLMWGLQMIGISPLKI